MCEQKPYPLWFSCHSKAIRYSVNIVYGDVYMEGERSYNQQDSRRRIILAPFSLFSLHQKLISFS